MKWLKKEYPNQMKKINEILKERNGIFQNEEEKDEVFSFADLQLNTALQGQIEYDVICNRIVLLECELWKMYFVVDRKGIVRGYKTENETTELKWQRENIEPYYDIVFTLDVEELSTYIGIEFELLEIYLNTIKNNLSLSFNKKNIQLRLKKGTKELIFDLEKITLGEEIKLTTLEGEEKLSMLEDEIFTKEIYEEILKAFN